MLQLARYLHYKLWQLLAWLIILGAVLFTLFRVALPLTDLTDYRQQIEQAVERRIGMPLRFNAMHARLYDARLAIKIDNLSLLDPETRLPRLHFREAHVQINLLRSLINGELILGRVMLVGGRFNLLRDRDGVFSLNGFRIGGGHNALLPILSRLQLSVKDCEIYWQDRLQDTAAVHLQGVDGRMVSDSRRHRLAATAQVGLERTERVRLIADVREGDEDPLAVEGRVYLKSEGLALDRRLPASLTGGVEIERGRLDLELWSEWVAGRIQRLQGSATLNGLLLSAAPASSLALDRLGALFDWRGAARDWQLDLDQIEMMEGRRVWPSGRMSLAWQADAGHKAMQLGIDYLGLAEANRFAVLLAPLGEEIRQVLTGLAPRGHLSRFRLALDRATGRPTRWRVSGSIGQYSQQAWKAVPGLAGLSLSFTGDQDGGGLSLNSKRFVADMPRLFRDQLTADRLHGVFRWRMDPRTGLQMKTRNLTVVTPDVHTLSRLELHLPWDGEHPFIDMQTDFWDGDGAQKSRYLPTGIMPDPLVKWLDHALVSGKVTSGSMLLYGPLKAFPFHHDEGRFEVLFGIEDMLLDYQTGWPRLEEVVAEAHFLNNSLAITLSDGKILNSRLHRTEARIRHLKGASPVQIDGSLEGPLRDLFRVLDESPLQQHFGRFTAAVGGSGQARTALQLQIPLKSADALKIQGQVAFQQAGLQLKDYDLTLQALRGQLHFDDTQVWASAIRGRLLDQPVELEVEPQQRSGEAETLIRTTLDVSSDWLQQRFPGLSELLDGQARTSLELRIAHGSSRVPVSLSFESPLRGMAVDLPEPLGKSGESARSLVLSVDFLDHRQRDLRVAYGGQLHARMRLQADRLRQGEVRFGGEAARLPLSERLHLAGSLPRLDLDAWSAWQHRHSGESLGAAALPLHVDLQVAELVLAGMEFPQVRFQVEPVARGWRAIFVSEDLNGEWILPRQLDRQPLVGRLKQLRLHSKRLLAEVPDRADRVAEPATEVKLDPRTLPGLDLQVDALWLDDRPYGKASLQWQRLPSGIEIKDLSIQGNDLTLEASGYWHRAGNKDMSQLQIKGHVESLGQLQQDLGLQLGIAKAPLDFDGVFDWPQAPYALEVKDLSGKLDLKVGAGEVTEVDPGVGRLVGLLSLHALGKRLSLDFSDLFAKGLEFDKIEGHFDIRDGNAYTQNLIMTSPSAQILIVGRTGLASRDYDQQVTVIPRVSSTLPLVGAIAVSPAVGVALVVTQELFGKQVDRIVQSQYKLTGSWDAPKILRLSRDDQDEEKKSSMMPDLPAR